MRKNISIVALFLTASCSTHPLPDQQWTRDHTRDIIQKIRCETKDALKQQLVALLIDPASSTAILRSGKDLARDDFDIGELVPSDFSIENYVFVDRFLKSRIGLSFLFTITETNNGSGKATFKFPFSNGTFSLGVSAGNDRGRKSTRDIKIQETFLSISQTDCTLPYDVRPNFIYPITGKIGIDEVIDTYIGLQFDIDFPDRKRSEMRAEEFKTLEAKRGSVGTFSDKIEFTTKFLSLIEPKIELSPVADTFKLAEATGKFDDSRTDVHELTIIIQGPKQKGTIEVKLTLDANGNIITKIPKTAKFDRSRSGVRRPNTFSISPEANQSGREELLREQNFQQQLGIQREIREKVQ